MTDGLGFPKSNKIDQNYYNLKMRFLFRKTSFCKNLICFCFVSGYTVVRIGEKVSFFFIIYLKILYAKRLENADLR